MPERVWASGLEATRVTIGESIAWVTLNRPAAANARNQTMRNELQRIWSGVAVDPEIEVVVLTGAGDRFFCAGMDLKEAAGPETPGERRDRLRASRDIEQLAMLPQPCIAAINGYALGGGLEMALACDLRVCSDTAQMGLTEVAHGLVPGGGGTQRLPRLVGLARAAELLYLGLRVSGREAVSLGLVNRCVAPEELHRCTAELAAAIAAAPTRAKRQAKELLRKSQELPLSAGVEYELEALLGLMADRAAGSTDRQGAA